MTEKHQCDRKSSPRPQWNIKIRPTVTLSLLPSPSCSSSEKQLRSDTSSASHAAAPPVAKKHWWQLETLGSKRLRRLDRLWDAWEVKLGIRCGSGSRRWACWALEVSSPLTPAWQTESRSTIRSSYLKHHSDITEVFFLMLNSKTWLVQTSAVSVWLIKYQKLVKNEASQFQRF